MSGHFTADLPPNHQEVCNNGAKDALGKLLISFGWSLWQPVASARIQALRR